MHRDRIFPAHDVVDIRGMTVAGAKANRKAA
jgi:hypothetical protein